MQKGDRLEGQAAKPCSGARAGPGRALWIISLCALPVPNITE